MVDISSHIPASVPTLSVGFVRQHADRLLDMLRSRLRWFAGLQFLIELSVIAIISIYAARGTLDMNPEMQIRGGELSYLVYPGAYAGEIFRRSGALPLWNPLLGSGEPLIEHAFSFVLNPFMVVPFLFEPAMVQAAKYALVIHIVLMGIGGWLLAYVLRLRAPARVFLGLLCASLGSFVGAIGGGFFQMSLSQVYVVYTFAGLLATLYRRERWGVGLFAVGGMLLLFAGIYWYVLPTFLIGSLLVLCALVGHWLVSKQPGSGIDRRMVKRFVLAALFLVGLGAIRLIPEALNYSVGIHPGEPFVRFNPFDETIQRYFMPIFSNDLMRYPQAYHYAFPANVFFGLLALRVITLLHPAVPRWRWGVWIPAVVAIWVFAIWAQVNNPIIHALYDAIPALHSWRLIERMQAGGSIWVAVLGAIMLDDLWRIARWYIRRVKFSTRLGASSRQIAKVAFAALSMVVVLYVGSDISGNWDRVSGVEPKGDLEGQTLAVIRSENPNGIVSVYTSDFFSYFSFPSLLVRGWTGNPDYRPRIESTVGDVVPNLLARFEPEFAVAAGFEYWNTEILQKYVDYPPTLGYARYNPYAISYAFAMPLATIQAHDNAYTLPTNAMSYELAYEHHVDSLIVYANGVSEETLIGAQETAYPGWQVTVNGQPRTLESLYGYLGVRIYPEDGEHLQIVFAYEPRALYAGGIITLVTAALTAIYLLRREYWLFPALRLMGIAPQRLAVRTPVRPANVRVAQSSTAPAPPAETSAAPAVKRMQIGLRKVEVELPPSTDRQTIEVTPGWSLRLIMVALAAATALAALCLFLLRMPSRKNSPPDV